MFYGRISDIYAGIITVALLVLFTFFSATAGDEWVVGVARFGGFNGMFGQGGTGEEIANFQIPPVALWLPGMAAPYAFKIGLASACSDAASCICCAKAWPMMNSQKQLVTSGGSSPATRRAWTGAGCNSRCQSWG